MIQLAVPSGVQPTWDSKTVNAVLIGTTGGLMCLQFIEMIKYQNCSRILFWLSILVAYFFASFLKAKANTKRQRQKILI
jgi:hypothetical protein